MVVSDDVLFGRLARSKLEKWGHSVAVERSGSDAFERIKKEMFRVVIMGWDLPGMKGAELCRRVRAMQRDRYMYLTIIMAYVKPATVPIGRAIEFPTGTVGMVLLGGVGDNLLDVAVTEIRIGLQHQRYDAGDGG